MESDVRVALGEINVRAFWCSYVGGQVLLMFQSPRLQSGRVRHHRNGYLMVWTYTKTNRTFVSNRDVAWVSFDCCPL